MSRFEILNETEVLDTKTNLIWMKDAGRLGKMTWEDAMIKLPVGWRLPTAEELVTLIDYTQVNPSLPPNHPFTNIQKFYYWSSTTSAYNADDAWFNSMWYGYLDYNNKTGFFYVWPVMIQTI